MTHFDPTKIEQPKRRNISNKYEYADDELDIADYPIRNNSNTSNLQNINLVLLALILITAIVIVIQLSSFGTYGVYLRDPRS